MPSNAAGRKAGGGSPRAPCALDGRPRTRSWSRRSPRSTASAAVLIAVFVPSERDVSPLLVVGAAGRPRGRVSSSLRVRRRVRRARAARRRSDAAAPPAAVRPAPDRGRGRTRPRPGLHQGQLGEGPLAEADRGLVARALAPVADPCGASRPGRPTLSSAPVYALAFAAQLATDFAQTVIRNRLLDGVPIRELARGFVGASPRRAHPLPRRARRHARGRRGAARARRCDRAARLAARQLLEGPAARYARRARAEPRLSRHGDAACPTCSSSRTSTPRSIRAPSSTWSTRWPTSSESRRTSARSSSSPRCCTTSARSRSPRRSSTSRRR